MEVFYAVLSALLGTLLIVFWVQAALLSKRLAASGAMVLALKKDAQEERQHHDSELSRVQAEAKDALLKAQALIDAQLGELKREAGQIREHYESEARKMKATADVELSKALQDLSSLKKFGDLPGTEAEVRRQLEQAIEESKRLRAEAEKFLEQSRTVAANERAETRKKADALRDQAEAILNQATRRAGQIVVEAEKRAQEVAGDAYTALREKHSLEQALKAIRNVVDGYGDRYVVPTHSLLEELASDFGHTAAGESLRAAREHSKRMVEQGEAADCDYSESGRRETAIRFVIDAFNGRVDAVLSRVKHDNYGTLAQEIRDAFSLVNLNGKAFRDARILPAYLESRLSELKWATVVQELRLKEREEQRRIQEQIREEEKVRREVERAIKEAESEEAAIKKAMEKARQEVADATADQQAELQRQLVELSQKLAEAEAKNQRAVSLAQQTRSGNVYVISNIGSFGEDVFKIGMTRRLDPMDRIYELSDASVPFDFDVHAIIQSDDAPKLESDLHKEFDSYRVNKVNFRKEFFRIPPTNCEPSSRLEGRTSTSRCRPKLTSTGRPLR
jgi:hypothetical protein